ncbi:MAG: ADP-ribosylglycohydrolase family protein [Coriobacteriia bacterium]|nr:ADP-ribosylglycohydrolase family protein [Coriobacteriia bacterium]
MLGAIAGDVIGSVHEHAGRKDCDFELFVSGSRFTDDTVLTVATAEAILSGSDYAASYHDYGNRYPHAGYGGAFRRWLRDESRSAYGSWGNGSAMRVSPIGLAASSVEQALAWAEDSAAVTHNHPEGIRGAQAVALAVHLARAGETKASIRAQLTDCLGYDLTRTVEEIRPGYSFEVSCQGSVPEAIIAFLESDSLESAIRTAISLGGDADTQAAIAGGIAEAFWGGVPDSIATETIRRLPKEFVDVISEFEARFPLSRPLVEPEVDGELT